MWICATCGTEAREPEVCSGCGSRMKPFNEPPKEKRYHFVLVLQSNDKDGLFAYGTFPNVMAADMWWDQHMREDRFDGLHKHEVVMMEAPDEAEAST